MTLDEIARLRDRTPPELELEAFVHGAMCMAYSGRCMISAYLTGRSANRGGCAQSCRWRYSLMEETRPGEYFPVEEDGNGTAILSSCDLNCLSFMDRLMDAGVTIMYDTRFAGVHRENGKIEGVIVENKSGRIGIAARAFVDASGDADVCFAAGEKTVSLNTNRRTGWYFSNGREGVKLRGLSDPLYPLDAPPKEGSRYYAGDKHEDVTQHAIDGRLMIMEHVRKLRAEGDPDAYPLIIPSYDGMRMTRRLSGAYTLDEKEVFTDFPDSIGLTGDWRKAGPVFAVPWRTIAGTQNANIAAAGRCISVTTEMWDITRVIPTAAMTGQAAGTGAAMCAKTGIAMGELPIAKLRDTLRANGMIIEKP